MTKLIKNISLQRKLRLYLRYFVAAFKALILCVVAWILYSDVAKQEMLESVYDALAEIGCTLDNIKITGNKHLTTDIIRASLSTDTGSPIFGIDIRNIKRKVEQNDWIKNVSVIRVLPNTIHINITEREPIAIWQNKQKLYLVDKEGHPIPVTNIGAFHLLYVVGNDANIYAQDLLNKISTFPELAKQIVYASRLGGRRWDLGLEQNILVKMPEEDFDIAWEYLIKLNKKNKLFDSGIKVLDLRDSTKSYIEKNEIDKSS